jgi:DNA-binding MarR family transcriptional regulator
MPIHDPIDRILDQWSKERPELDGRGFAIVGRVLTLAKLLERRVAQALEPLELSLWGFDVMATLRRQGAPYRMTPTELSRSTMLTSGAMTNRLDRLEAKGWLQREADPDDRRGVRVVLTRAGRKLVDRAIELRFHEANSAVAELSATNQRAIEAGLRRLLVALDRDVSTR